VVEGEALEEIFADADRLSNRFKSIVSLPDGRRTMPGEADGKEHVYTRRAAAKAFSPSTIKALQPRINQILLDLIARVKPRGRCDYMHDFALDLPMRLFMTLMDLPQEDGPMLQALTDKIPRSSHPEEREAAKQGLYDYLGAVIDRRIADPGTDPISQFGQSDYFDGVMPRDLVLSISANVLMGGLDTVASFLGFAMLHLAENPAERHRLATEEGAVDAMLPELLRRFSVAGLARNVIEDYEYRGIRLKAGEKLFLPTVMHAMDEREFERPLEIQPDRSIETLMTFGRGKHQCVGQFLARQEVREALIVWLREIPEFRLAVPRDSIRVRCGSVSALESLPLAWD